MGNMLPAAALFAGGLGGTPPRWVPAPGMQPGYWVDTLGNPNAIRYHRGDPNQDPTLTPPIGGPRLQAPAAAQQAAVAPPSGTLPNGVAVAMPANTINSTTSAQQAAGALTAQQHPIAVPVGPGQDFKKAPQPLPSKQEARTPQAIASNAAPQPRTPQAPADFLAQNGVGPTNGPGNLDDDILAGIYSEKEAIPGDVGKLEAFLGKLDKLNIQDFAPRPEENPYDTHSPAFIGMQQNLMAQFGQAAADATDTALRAAGTNDNNLGFNRGQLLSSVATRQAAAKGQAMGGLLQSAYEKAPEWAYRERAARYGSQRDKLQAQYGVAQDAINTRRSGMQNFLSGASGFSGQQWARGQQENAAKAAADLARAQGQQSMTGGLINAGAAVAAGLGAALIPGAAPILGPVAVQQGTQAAGSFLNQKQQPTVDQLAEYPSPFSAGGFLTTLTPYEGSQPPYPTNNAVRAKSTRFAQQEPLDPKNRGAGRY